MKLFHKHIKMMILSGQDKH